MSGAHHEKQFENYVVEKLVAQGWLLGETSGYDKEHALYPEDVVAWLRDTQPAKWDRLVTMNGDKAAQVLLDRLAQALDKNGTVQVLRRGFDIAGCGHIDVSEAAPRTSGTRMSCTATRRTACGSCRSSATTPARSTRSIWACSSTAPGRDGRDQNRLHAVGRCVQGAVPARPPASGSADQAQGAAAHLQARGRRPLRYVRQRDLDGD